MPNYERILKEGLLSYIQRIEKIEDDAMLVGATPDGREKGTPLCDSIAAVFGKDTVGTTALLKSVASLDLKRALGIPVLNFNINPDFDDATLKALISGYMKL